jgi:hypothetical protein
LISKQSRVDIDIDIDMDIDIDIDIDDVKVSFVKRTS